MRDPAGRSLVEVVRPHGGFLPLGSLTLLRAWHQVPQRVFGRGLAAGIAVHAVITALAFAFARA